MAAVTIKAGVPAGGVTTRTHTATFAREKETKNTVKFEEVAVEGRATIIGTLYVQKHVAGSAETIEVTVKVG